MYNEERKIQFIREARNSENYGRSVFRTTETYEKAAGKDFCELPLEVLQTIMNQNFGSRTRTMDVTIAFLRSYVDWCKKNGYPASDGIYNVQTQMDEKVKRLMVASPKHLQSKLDNVFSPVESGTMDCIYRCYLWMSFSGIEAAEALEVKVSEVDFTSMQIDHGGMSYELYREAIPAFRMACEATEFQYEHENPKYTQKRNRYPGEYLMRGIRSEKIKATSIKGAIQKAFKAKGVELTYSTIRLSGIFYQAYENERMNMPVNFRNIAAEHINKSNSTYHGSYTKSKAFNLIQRDLFNDYVCWKAVFT